MKRFKNPYLSILLSLLGLFVSCDQNDSELKDIVQNFDYENFETYKNSNHFDSITAKISASNKKGATSILETNKLILSSVNDELDSNVFLPDSSLSLSVDMEADDIYTVANTNGWLDNSNIELARNFSKDSETVGFDMAVINYQNKVLSLNLSNEEFVKNNLFINIVKSLNYENPGLFKLKTNIQSRGGFRCALATVALAATTAGLLSCVTVVACSLALLLQVNAVYSFNDHCLNGRQ